MRNHKVVSVALGALLCVVLAACGTTTGDSASDSGGGSDPLAGLDASSLVPEQVVAKGPYNETSATPDDVALTSDDEARIRDAQIKVGIVMQTMDIEWSTEQVRGITDQVAQLGGAVVGTCNGSWAVDKQTACIDDMITKAPDAIISIPVDDVGMAPAYARVAAAGIKLIFIDNIAKGLEFPTQYQGLVTADNRGNGEAAAQALAEYLPEGATAGVLDYGVDFETTKERTRGFQEWMAANRPDVTVKVAEFQDPAKAGDIAANFLTANPDVAGMFTVWEVPAMGIITALRGQGKTMPITVVNLASDIALDMASGGMVKMIGAQRPYDEGVAEANMAARAVVGIDNPAFLAFPATPVIQNNLLTAWKSVYKSDAPSEIVDACAGSCK
ncbi:substrate-binding domain-containing protein [Isoptericola sp. b441]|uniref:Substrate-binding domain-containing protein n=1 Tax=Actinotalea lenta TaxID=3064654 RepID=A0ABT9DF87_9CELL|nr:substrate-binding domain-containing protein [Isoptericola sp. b441]MDO8108628.1 substrate-binding domain-containing protein [Isoptericola sp. b441]